ncbi:MAG TPA: BLUF domain-containing protein [Ramlibacter sp.]|nr:BLUF domain-containing protein [Ramlibacter sp.]
MESVAAPPGWHENYGGDQTVARFMYASQAIVHGSIYAEMERIRASAVRHNEPAGVATALLYQSGWFAQWKEGPREALLSIMQRVEADPRHHSMRIVHSSRGSRMLAGPWSMAVVQCDEPAGDMAQRVEMLCRELEAGRQSSPQTAWRRLSTPMRHPGAGQQADPDAFQRVLVCAAEGMGSFDLVRWLGHLHGQEVVHRRFAGAYDLDVGTDYVDFAEGGRVLRVIAMARHGLALPLTRAFLPDYSHVVLLLSDDLERDLLLAQRVAYACGGLTASPAILGLARNEAAHKEIFALARHHGLIYLAAQCSANDEKRCWAAISPLLANWRHAINSGWPVVALRA